MSAHHHHAPFRRAVLGVVVSALAVSSLFAAPSPALASRLSSDRVGGYRLSSSVVATASAPDISARSGVLVAWDGRVLWSRKAGIARPMASTTKLMTALIVLERCDLDEVVTVSRAAARTPYAVGLRAGERRTVRQLLRLTLVASSNDAAVALAEHVSGSRRRFVGLMNRRAAQLGLTDTHYANPHGLDADGHHTSPADLAALTRIVRRDAEFRRIARMRSVVLPRYGSRPERRLKATNTLLGEFAGLEGGKTGYTADARYCLSLNATRDGLGLTSVVLGSPTSRTRFSSSRRLLEWGFRNYRHQRLCSADQTATLIPVSGESSASIVARFDRTVSVRVLRPLGPVRTVLSVPASATVDVAGGHLGVARFVQNGSVIATAGVIAGPPVTSR